VKKEFLWWRDGVIYQIYPLGLSSTKRKPEQVGSSPLKLRANEVLILIEG